MSNVLHNSSLQKESTALESMLNRITRNTGEESQLFGKTFNTFFVFRIFFAFVVERGNVHSCIVELTIIIMIFFFFANEIMK